MARVAVVVARVAWAQVLVLVDVNAIDEDDHSPWPTCLSLPSAVLSLRDIRVTQRVYAGTSA